MGARAAAFAYAGCVIAVLLVGAWVLAPTLRLGLMADDYMGIAVARGEFSGDRNALDAFNFGMGTAQDIAAVQRLGTLPWWTAPGFRLAFLRPLSSAQWRIDQALFGDDTWLYHAHSIAVWAALAIAAGALYRRLFRWPIAALACAIFALDQSQHTPVLWLSNRGGLYAVLFGVLGLSAHLAWRERGRRAHGVLACACTGVALAFGEWALPALAYFAAYELLGSRDAPARRVRALLPLAAITLAFLGMRAVLGYGARGSGAYVDPAAEPLRFAVLLLHRIPVFAADMLANLPADHWDNGSPWRDRVLELELFPPSVWAELPDWRTVHVVLGVSALALLALLAWRALRRLPDEERRAASWLLAGSALALVPVVGSFPSTRLTLAAVLGAAPAFALIIRHLARSLVERACSGRARGFALGWLLFCGALYTQLIAPLRVRLDGDVDYMTTARAWVLSAQLDPRRVARQRVMMLSSSEFITTFFWAYTWHHHGRPMPASYYPLSAAPTAHDVERTAPDELVLRPLGSLLLESPGEQMFRARELAWHDGDEVTLPGLRVHVEGVRDGLPISVRMRFDFPLEDPSLAFLVSTTKGLTRFQLPEVGETVRVPAPTPANLLTLQETRDRARFGPYPEALAYAPVPWFVAYEPSP